MKIVGIIILVCGVISMALSAVFVVSALVQGAGVESWYITGLLVGCFLIAYGISLIRKNRK